jgi:hypothetical protein
MSPFIEEILLDSVKTLLSGAVCTLLAKTELNVPALEDISP